MSTLRTSSGKLPIAIILAVILVLFAGVGAFTFTRMRAKGGKADDKHGDKPAKLSMWKLEEFIVNLADRDDSRYLKISLVLEIAGDGKEGGGEGEGNPQEAKARDAVITVLTRKRFADLISEQGKVQLKTELKSELNTVLEGAQVVNIYFSSFAMQ